MNDTHLVWFHQGLRKLEAAGELANYQIDFHAELRDRPRNDRLRWPLVWPYIDRLATLGEKILGEPKWKCKRAARDAVLASTRQQIAIDLMHDYLRRIEAERERPGDEAWLRGRR